MTRLICPDGSQATAIQMAGAFLWENIQFKAGGWIIVTSEGQIAVTAEHFSAVWKPRGWSKDLPETGERCA